MSFIALIQVGVRPVWAGNLNVSLERFNTTQVSSANNSADVRKKLVLEGVQKALASLEEAIPTASQHFDVQEKLKKSFESLKKAQVQWPENDEDDIACIDDFPMGAYVLSGVNKIFVCKIAFTKSQAVEVLAQILVHESTHLWQNISSKDGLDDRGRVVQVETECEALQVELYTVSHSSLGLHYKSSYWGMCGIK